VNWYTHAQKTTEPEMFGMQIKYTLARISSLITLLLIAFFSSVSEQIQQGRLGLENTWSQCLTNNLEAQNLFEKLNLNFLVSQ